ncbi:hypothetical protein K3495_g99 [Podosphaera aphanis]|nr:hypothetical protein K3495_g99 [Podosphaera aphanis]
MNSLITTSMIPDLGTGTAQKSIQYLPGHSKFSDSSIIQSPPSSLPQTSLPTAPSLRTLPPNPIPVSESLPVLPSGHLQSPISSLILIIRQLLKAYLSSRTHKLVVIVLVLLNVLKSLAGLSINLDQIDYPDTPLISFLRKGIEIVGLMFSYVFVVELIISIWTLGFRYFLVPGHIVDGAVIAVNYLISTFLHGAVEQYASLVVLIRLWRVFAKVRPAVIDPASLRLLHDPPVPAVPVNLLVPV